MITNEMRGRAIVARTAALLVCACFAPVACITAGAPAVGDAPAASAEAADVPVSGSFRVAVISDLNESYGSVGYRAEVTTAVTLLRERWRPQLVLAAGDLIAGQRPTLSDERVRAMWAAFDSVVAAPLRAAGIPFGFALGNHDASWYPAHQRDRAVAIEHWRAPARYPGVSFVDSTHFPLYYSIRQGPLFIVAWDATWEGTHSDSVMMEWLRQQLTSDGARAAPFRIVLGHLPLYAVAEGRNRPGEILAEPESLRALLEEHGVHMYISGHHHAYYPGRRGALELLHAGALGDGVRPLLGDTAPSPRTVTLLDFDSTTGALTYTTFAIAGAAATHVVRTGSLPPRLDGATGWVWRRDLCGPGTSC
jgi:hypothetical protein